MHAGADMTCSITKIRANALLRKVNDVVYFDTLFSLEEDFNKVGLSVQLSGGNRVILCKIVGGKASAATIMEDYIFIGPFAGAGAEQEISERLMSSISNFISHNAGTPAKIESTQRTWQQGVKTYGQAIRIAEDIQEIAQSINE
jgi:hypothetical protein